jgi:hypothetical protein
MGENIRKLNLFARYLPHIKGVESKDGGRMLTIDFGRFLVIDNNGETDYAYFYEKRNPDQVWEESAFDAGDRKFYEAREFILEDVDDEYIRLNFHSIGRLYVAETLDILLGLKPDTRASKSILAGKKKSMAWGGLQ